MKLGGFFRIECKPLANQLGFSLLVNSRHLDFICAEPLEDLPNSERLSFIGSRAFDKERILEIPLIKMPLIYAPEYTAFYRFLGAKYRSTQYEFQGLNQHRRPVRVNFNEVAFVLGFKDNCLEQRSFVVFNDSEVEVLDITCSALAQELRVT